MDTTKNYIVIDGKKHILVQDTVNGDPSADSCERCSLSGRCQWDLCTNIYKESFYHFEEVNDAETIENETIKEFSEDEPTPREETVTKTSKEYSVYDWYVKNETYDDGGSALTNAVQDAYSGEYGKVINMTITPVMNPQEYGAVSVGYHVIFTVELEVKN